MRTELTPSQGVDSSCARRGLALAAVALLVCGLAFSPAFARPLENSDLPTELRDQNIAATLKAEHLAPAKTNAQQTNAQQTNAQQTNAAQTSWKQVGVASFYRRSKIFRRTATGENYNENAMTAAHRTLPLGSKVKVTDLANGRSVVVRINDRPAASNPRVIDLARGAASRLGMIGAGIADVELTLLPDNTPVEVAEAPDYLDPPIAARHPAHHTAKPAAVSPSHLN